MKRRVPFFFLIIFFIVSLSFSASIVVTNPHGGNTWYKGNTYTITWTKTGAMNANVKIRLMKNGTKVLGIADLVANNGSFSWTIPASVAPGTYQIRVKTVDNLVYDDSEPFVISESLSHGSINIINPVGTSKWCKGNSYEIKWWTTSGDMNPRVKIRLYQGNTKVLAIVDNTANDGSFHWTPPTSLSDGIYFIRVKTVDNLVYGDSEPFEIKTCGGPVLDNLNIVAGMDLVELAIYMHGPGPRIREMGKIKEILEKAGIEKPVTIMLYRGNERIINLGTFAPTVRSGRVSFNTMPSVLNLNLPPQIKEQMARNPEGYKIVLFSSGRKIGEKTLKINVKTVNNRRIQAQTINPKILKNIKVLNQCPDPAVVDIKFSIVRKYSKYRARVRITGVVKNIGKADYISNPNQQTIVLDSGDAAHPLKVIPFKDLRAGQTIIITHEVDWDISSPNEGEFPPTFRVYILYDPDITMDENTKNDDCNSKNNSMSKSGRAINDMIRNS